MMSKPQIRPFTPADFDAVTILWRISREKSLPQFQKEHGHFFYEDQYYFRDHILTENQVWVLEETGSGRPAAFIAIKDDFIDHLFVHPDHWQKRIGEQLLDFARTLSPRRLWLYTLQDNLNARAFYRKNGFRAIAFGMSPPPENQPDVTYEWLAGTGG
jgi:GNAT superfamily N-acetyltransferase